MANDEGHFLGRAERGGDNKIAFVLTVVVIGDDDNLAPANGLDGLGDGMRHADLHKPPGGAYLSSSAPM
jgi:hypothetical protein